MKTLQTLVIILMIACVWSVIKNTPTYPDNPIGERSADPRAEILYRYNMGDQTLEPQAMKIMGETLHKPGFTVADLKKNQPATLLAESKQDRKK